MAPVAQAARASYQIPRRDPEKGSVLRASPDAHVSFELPASYKQQYGAMAGTRATGSYQRTTRLESGGRCELRLDAVGRAQSTKPMVGRRYFTLPFRPR